MKTAYPITAFINIQVWVKKNTDQSGYEVRCEPVVPMVVQKDTVINYQIVETYGQDIVFSGLEVTPDGLNQISLPSISLSGKQLTVSDANTQCCRLNLFLEFTDKTLGHSFKHDPQVENDTQA